MIHAVRIVVMTSAVMCALATLVYGAENPVSLFELKHVRLLDGPFKQAQETDRRYILAHDPDRLLAPFRREAGLPMKGEPYGNWESMGLDGHTAGHYLGALAMMYASTGDAEIKRRMDYMVAELAECQKAGGNGYVGGVPHGQKLWGDIAAGKIDANGFGLNGVWVPWYNVHKTFAGLRDAYQIGGNEQAKTLLIGLSDWCTNLLSHLSDEQVQTMLRAEHGGMAEVLAEVFAITSDPKYLAAANRFCDLAILTPLAHEKDELTHNHANTQIPKVIGFEVISQLSDAPDDHKAAEFFWQTVTARRSASIGGNSVNEHFHALDDFSSMIEDRTGPETCNTFNMLRLTEKLFARDPQARYADFYERALFNHILSSQNPAHGGFVYFTPMRPQHYRVYSQAGQGFWCCVGTGFENHAKYGQFIYAHRGGDELFVNLFIASELTWPERELVLRQETTFPESPESQLKIGLKHPSTFTLSLRRPEWVSDGSMTVTVNGQAQSAAVNAQGYISLARQWNDGDSIRIKMPMHIIVDPLPGKLHYASLRYGPIVLAMPTGKEDLKDLYAGAGRGDHVASGKLLPLASAPMLVADNVSQLASSIVPVADVPLTFQASAVIKPDAFKTVSFVPFYRLHETRYSIYLQVVSPSEYEIIRQKLADTEKPVLQLEKLILDRVTPGAQQSEVDHQYAGAHSHTGVFHDVSWRDAGRSGDKAESWFSYVLANPQQAPAALAVTYYGRDKGRNFQILINDVKIAHVQLKGDKGDDLYVERYAIPADLKPPYAVKFFADPGSIAGGIFDLKLIRTNNDAARTSQ